MKSKRFKVGDTVSFLSHYNFVDDTGRLCVAAIRKRFHGVVTGFTADDGVKVASADGPHKSVTLYNQDKVQLAT